MESLFGINYFVWLCAAQPRYMQLKAVKSQQSPGVRTFTPAKDKPRPDKSLQQPEHSASATVTTASSQNRLQDRHFMDAIVRLSPIQRKVRLAYMYCVGLL